MPPYSLSLPGFCPVLVLLSGLAHEGCSHELLCEDLASCRSHVHGFTPCQSLQWAFNEDYTGFYEDCKSMMAGRERGFLVCACRVGGYDVTQKTT